jgi:hypothetical protein
MRVERKRWKERKEKTQMGGPFIMDIEEDCRFGSSAKDVSEARIT